MTTKPQHTPTLKLELKKSYDYANATNVYLVCLDDGTGLGAELIRTTDLTIAEPIVRAVNSHEEILAMLKKIRSAMPSELGDILVEEVDRDLARSEGR